MSNDCPALEKRVVTYAARSVNSTDDQAAGYGDLRGSETRGIRHRFKKVHDGFLFFSARVDLHWRAVGVPRDDAMIWFWVGPHSEYEKLIKRL